MTRLVYVKFAADIRRWRPLAVVVLALLSVMPSGLEMLRQGLSPVTVLARLVLALVVLGILVWGISGLVLRYARIQSVASERVRLTKDEGDLNSARS